MKELAAGQHPCNAAALRGQQHATASKHETEIVTSFAENRQRLE